MRLLDRLAQLRDGRHDSELPEVLGRMASFHRVSGGMFARRGLQRQLLTSGWRMVGMVCLAVAAAIVTFLLANR
jgi:hypothetical protein